MSQASHLSRYRPAVFAITGVAAACGIYILYSTYADRPSKSALHRSNAIHRSRSTRQPQILIEWTRPTADSPLGDLVVRRNADVVAHNLAGVRMLKAVDVISILGLAEDSLSQSELNVAAVQSVLQACYVSRSSAQRERLDDLGLRGLCEATAHHDVEGITVFRSRIAAMLDGVPMQQINSGMQKFVASDLWQSWEIPSSDSDEMTYAETEDVDGVESETNEPSQGLKGLLYHIAETDAKRKAYEHRGIHCEGCGERPIRGVRWHCLNCPDFDFCSTCESDNDHIKTHVFAKIKVPLPVLSQPTKECPLWYPGDPRKMHPPLKSSVKKRLEAAYHFDGPQIDAHYDQFICISNMPWSSDPSEVKAAIDRRAFDKALTSERWPQRFRPNALYDRMFAFYDTNHDGLIGFEEFVDGIAYLRGPKRYTPLSRALEGFDIDGDGWVDRDDFIRLFRAKHEIQKLIIEDMIEGHEAEHTRSAMDTIRSSQPISAIFSLDEIPQGEHRPPQGKVLRNGDMELQYGTKTVLEDYEGWSEDAKTLRRRRMRNHTPGPSYEQLQGHLSRFEEMLNSQTDGVNGIHSDVIDGSNDANVQHEEQSNGVSGPDGAGKPRADGTPIESQEGRGDVPLNQDILWQFIEEGFHEMLDPFFKSKEQDDREVTDTREERRKWCSEIDEVAQEQRQATEKETWDADLKNAAMIDPLVATAMSSEGRGPTIGRGDQDRPAFVPGPFVPTDSESLARREEEITQQPLEGLLSTTGYRRLDADEANETNPAPSDVTETAKNDGHHAADTPTLTSSEPRRDPTMPQNRPNSSPSEDAIAPEKPQILKPPPLERLNYLLTLDHRERQMKLRGGPGRLSYDEVEELVKADTTRELRGLVISWLEWASF